MREIMITNELRERVNHYLGYELIKKNEVGHHIYDEAPGLGKIGIEGNDVGHIMTIKQLDRNGNIEWYKSPNIRAHSGEVKSFHCKLTTVSSKKAKILMASLFPEEIINEEFLIENYDAIQELKGTLRLVSQKTEQNAERERLNPMLMGPNDLFFEGAHYMLSESLPSFSSRIL